MKIEELEKILRECFKTAEKDEKISERYEEMTNLCKKAIFQCEEIVFSNKEFKVPKELYE